jgi:hypothetical protein
VRTLAVAFVLAGALAACDAPGPPVPRLWTLFDVQSLYARGKVEADAIATDAGLPGGVPLGSMLDASYPELFVHASLAEGYRAAYVTTEVWSHFPEVWVQPMYVPITGWVGGVPQRVVDANGAWHPIFSVGPHSAFYSPFWQMIFAEVPPGTADGSLTSVRQIIDGGYRLVPSIGWLAALTPGPVSLDPQAPSPSGGAAAGEGWLDGSPVSFVKFPAAPFTWNDDLVVAEVPIFHFVFVQADGALVAPDLPSVLGTGPLYSRTPPPVDLAKYSAYWRLYTVTVPATARVFDPFNELGGALADAGIPLATKYGPDITDTAAVRDFVGRIALDENCFSTVDNLDPREGGTCVYLDSQQSIEAHVGRVGIQPTDVTVTCPLVSIRGLAVGP